MNVHRFLESVLCNLKRTAMGNGRLLLIMIVKGGKTFFFFFEKEKHGLGVIGVKI